MKKSAEPRPSRIAGCTTVALNYLPFARTLAEAWNQHQPTDPFYVLIVDGTPHDSEGQPFKTVTPNDIGIEARELLIQMGMYGPLEMSTALKPALLSLLLERGHEAALFVDPDSYIFSPLDDLAAASLNHGVALTPHVTTPYPDDGKD